MSWRVARCRSEDPVWKSVLDRRSDGPVAGHKPRRRNYFWKLILRFVQWRRRSKSGKIWPSSVVEGLMDTNVNFLFVSMRTVKTIWPTYANDLNSLDWSFWNIRNRFLPISFLNDSLPYSLEMKWSLGMLQYRLRNEQKSIIILPQLAMQQFYRVVNSFWIVENNYGNVAKNHWNILIFL